MMIGEVAYLNESSEEIDVAAFFAIVGVLRKLNLKFEVTWEPDDEAEEDDTGYITLRVMEL